MSFFFEKKNIHKVFVTILFFQERGFASLYEWQRDHVSGPEYVLHDGPPYANGVPHMGHAINKVSYD